jgi:2-polyprenyl-6-methoxyphenol hydroxylase-like FAD-dependent oxidoreductase
MGSVEWGFTLPLNALHESSRAAEARSSPSTPTSQGQGGCTALEDAVVLAVCVDSALSSSSSAPPPSGPSVRLRALEASLRRFERERSLRCAPLTVRSGLMGMALQVPLPPVCAARDLLVASPLFAPVQAHFLDHCAAENYDIRKVAADIRASSWA